MTDFGTLLRHFRTARGMSLRRLAYVVNFDHGYIGQVERRKRAGSLQLAQRCDEALAAAGDLVRAFQSGRSRPTAHRKPTLKASPALEWAPILSATPAEGEEPVDRRSLLTGAGLSLAATTVGGLAAASPSTGRLGESMAVEAAAGNLFTGTYTPGIAFPAVEKSRVLIDLPQSLPTSRFWQAPHRQLILGVSASGQVYGQDLRAVRHRTARGSMRLAVPHAYRLDDITSGLLWSIANLEDALSADDAALEHHLRHHLIDKHRWAPVALDELSPVSRAWLGSDFCARHITENLTALADPPRFWTREQKGEEASTWLVFRHKHDYLHTVAETYQDTTLDRSFCIPAQALASPRFERTLLLLTLGLMESFGIRINISPEPEYTAVEGFVSDRQTAILANWVGATHGWHIDITQNRPTVVEYTEALEHAASESIAAADTPRQRLRAACDYLGLNWNNLVTRCRELSDYGLDGFIQPRHRFLSLRGAQRAVDFLAHTSPHD